MGDVNESNICGIITGIAEMTSECDTKYRPTHIYMHRKDYKRYRKMMFWNKVKSIFKNHGLVRNYRSRN